MLASTAEGELDPRVRHRTDQEGSSHGLCSHSRSPEMAPGCLRAGEGGAMEMEAARQGTGVLGGGRMAGCGLAGGGDRAGWSWPRMRQGKMEKEGVCGCGEGREEKRDYEVDLLGLGLDRD